MIDPLSFPFVETKGKVPENKLTVQQVQVNRGWFTIPTEWDVLAGFHFDSWVPQTVWMTIGNAEWIEFPVKDKQVRGFWTFLSLAHLIDISIKFTGENQPATVNCAFVVGNLDNETKHKIYDTEFSWEIQAGNKIFTMTYHSGVICQQIKKGSLLQGFEPAEFPLMETKLTDKRISLRPGDGTTYCRFTIPVQVGGDLTVRHYSDIFEGIQFTTWVPERVKMVLGSEHTFEFQIEGKRFQPRNFWMPLVAMHLTDVRLSFIGPNKPDTFWCFLVVGNLQDDARREIATTAMQPLKLGSYLDYFVDNGIVKHNPKPQ